MCVWRLASTNQTTPCFPLSQSQIKRIFLEGNPYLLALTMAVSMLHSVFDFLAFKNDIGFWKENKSMEGLSARSIVINAFCQLVSCWVLPWCVFDEVLVWFWCAVTALTTMSWPVVSAEPPAGPSGDPLILPIKRRAAT
jgi:hypothetical protein